jgi:hypothetical protein
VTLLDVLSAATASNAVDQYQKATLEGRDPTAVLTWHDLVGLLGAVMLLATWVVGSFWLSRVQANAEAIAPGEQRRSPAWAWLGWLVPIVSLWFPKQIVDDSWRVTSRAGREDEPVTARRRDDTGWWWPLWIVYLVLLNITVRIGLSDGGTNQGVYPGLEIAVAVVSLAAFAAWVPVVRGLTAEQDRLAATRLA